MKTGVAWCFHMQVDHWTIKDFILPYSLQLSVFLLVGLDSKALGWSHIYTRDFGCIPLLGSL